MAFLDTATHLVYPGIHPCFFAVTDPAGGHFYFDDCQRNPDDQDGTRLLHVYIIIKWTSCRRYIQGFKISFLDTIMKGENP
jgi:hypothetical protein